MIPGRFEKQSYEEFYWGADFDDVVDEDNESIVLGSSSITAYDNTDTEDTTVYDEATLVVVNSVILAVRVKAGTEGKSPYKLTYKITTTAGNKYEKDVLMTVEEV